MENSEFIVPPPGLLPARQDTERVAPRPIPQAVRAHFTPPATQAPVNTIPSVLAQAQSPVLGAWHLSLADGQQLSVSGSYIIGRDPAPVPARPHGVLIVVNDPARSVSKTHAIVDLEDGQLSVTDLHSTNGVAVTRADGTRLELDAGTRAELLAGSRIQLGDFLLTVSRELPGV